LNIVINSAAQRFGGAIQVALSFIYECRKFPNHKYHVWVGPGVSKSLNKEDFQNNFTFHYFDFGIIDFRAIKHIQKVLSKAEKYIQPDIIICTSGPSYFHSKAPQIIGFNLPLYIYPESPFVKELGWRKKLKLWLKKQAHIYYFKRDGDAYVVQTNDVNQRTRKLLKTDEVYTVTNNHNAYFTEQYEKYPKKLPSKKQNEFRWLTLSAYYPHKDLEIIPKVAKTLRVRGVDDVRFILTLKPDDFKKKLDPHPDIINIGPVNPEQCPSLYQECDGMFLPTLAECFSASYPEAMVMKRPIVTTDLGFAKSICGDAAQYYKAKDTESAADSIQKVIYDFELKRDLIQEGKQALRQFDTAEERAKKYLEICELTLQKHTSK